MRCRPSIPLAGRTILQEHYGLGHEMTIFCRQHRAQLRSEPHRGRYPLSGGRGGRGPLCARPLQGLPRQRPLPHSQYAGVCPKAAVRVQSVPPARCHRGHLYASHVLCGGHQAGPEIRLPGASPRSRTFGRRALLPMTLPAPIIRRCCGCAGWRSGFTPGLTPWCSPWRALTTILRSSIGSGPCPGARSTISITAWIWSCLSIIRRISRWRIRTWTIRIPSRWSTPALSAR